MTITLATRGALPFTAIGRADGWAAVPQSWRRFFALAGRDGPYASFAVENPFLDAARGGILAPSAFQAPMVRRLNSRLTGASRAHPEQNEVRRIIAETVVALGRRLGVTVVWKGVETWARRTLLEEMQCPAGQGRLLSRPAKRRVQPYFLLRMSSNRLIRLASKQQLLG